MTRHEKLVGMFISGKLALYPWGSKSDDDLDAQAQQFEEEAKQYISAIEQNRVICFIHGVSRSGMSRRMSFKACEPVHKKVKAYYYSGLNQFISVASGYRLNKDYELVVEGCGMDMVFNTNYNVINELQRIGYLSKKRAENLAQKTPTSVY